MRDEQTIAQVIMKWTGCLRFTLKLVGDAVISWVALSRNLRLNVGQIGEASVDLEHDRGRLRAENWTGENESGDIVLGTEGWGRW